MKNLRNIRIALAAIFFLAAALCVVLPACNLPVPKSVDSVAEAQVQPSAFYLRSSAALVAGITLCWLVVSLLCGRIYCATLCPIGSMTDAVVWLRNRTKFRTEYSYKKPQGVRISLLVIYIATLALGQLVFAFIIEPWNIWTNIGSIADRNLLAGTWVEIGIPSLIGLGFGVLSLLGLILMAWFGGRSFCTAICPVGTALGVAANYAPVQLTIDPDRCSSCMKCERTCQASCIKVSERLIDNSRCIRCLDCAAVCPDRAINFTSSRMRPSSPLFRNS